MIERKLYDVFKKKSSYLYSICDCICSHPARERELVSTSMLNWTERCTHTVDTIKSVWFTSMTIKSLNEIIDIDKFIMFALLPLNIHSFQFKHASWQVNKLSTCFSTHSAYTHTHTHSNQGEWKVSTWFLTESPYHWQRCWCFSLSDDNYWSVCSFTFPTFWLAEIDASVSTKSWIDFISSHRLIIISCS